MIIDRSQPIPLYFQLKTHLLEEILSGSFGPEGRLPTEHEMCELFGLSRTPVTRALSELAAEGVIIRHRRRGSFVNPHWLRRPPPSREIRLLVPDGPWETMVRRATPPGGSFSVATVPLDSLLQAVRQAVGEGRAPDIGLVDSVWVPELAAAGFLWPMEDLDPDWFELEYVADFLQPLAELNRYQDKTFAVQAEADVAGLWIRRDHLDEIGGEVPENWESLAQMASDLSRRSGAPRNPLVFPGGSRGGETTTYCLLALLASNGVRVISDDLITLDDPRTVAGLRFLRRLLDQGLVSPDVVSYEWDRPIRMLATGEASLSFGGSYEGRTLATMTGIELQRLTEQFVFAPMPAGPHGPAATLAGGMSYAIFRQAHDPKQAMGVLEHLLDADALTRMARETGQIPPRQSLALAVGAEVPFLADTVSMLNRTVVRPAIPAHARVSSQLQSMFEGVLTGRFGPAAAAERTAELVGAITGLEPA
jgi:multiple sugar transport system substrate-binding protein